MPGVQRRKKVAGEKSQKAWEVGQNPTGKPKGTPNAVTWIRTPMKEGGAMKLSQCIDQLKTGVTLNCIYTRSGTPITALNGINRNIMTRT